MELTREQQDEVVRRLKEAFPDAAWSEAQPMTGVERAKARGLELRSDLANEMAECKNRWCNAWAAVGDEGKQGFVVMVDGSTAAVKMGGAGHDGDWRAFKTYWDAPVFRDKTITCAPVSWRMCPEHLRRLLNRLAPRVLVMWTEASIAWWREGRGTDLVEGGGTAMFRGQWAWMGSDEGLPMPCWRVYVPEMGAGTNKLEVSLHDLERYVGHGGTRNPGVRCVKCGVVCELWDTQMIPWCRAHYGTYGKQRMARRPDTAGVAGHAHLPLNPVEVDR
jgi:hypothetical protein